MTYAARRGCFTYSDSPRAPPEVKLLPSRPYFIFTKHPFHFISPLFPFFSHVFHSPHHPPCHISAWTSTNVVLTTFSAQTFFHLIAISFIFHQSLKLYPHDRQHIRHISFALKSNFHSWNIACHIYLPGVYIHPKGSRHPFAGKPAHL